MNNKPRFRNPDKYQLLAWREWGRDKLPNGNSGMVQEDLDLVSLIFGPLINRLYNADGKFMLIEIKTSLGEMGYAQKRVFSLIHRLLRKADPSKNFYIGFYLVRWNLGEQDIVDCCKDCPNKPKVNPGKPEKVNERSVTEQEYIEFLKGKIEIPSMFDEGDKR